MTLRYRLSEDDCLELIAHDIRIRNSRPAYLLMTYGIALALLIACSWAWHSGSLAGMQLIAVGGGSIILSATTIYFRLDVRRQARASYRQAKRAGKFADDFWQQHTLTLNNGKIHLHYGKVHDIIDCRHIERSIVLGKGILIYNGESPVELVPGSAFSTLQERNDFLMQLFETLREEMRESVREQLKQLTTNIICSYSYRYDADRFLRDQRAACRMIYATTVAWNAISWIRTGFCLFMIYYTVNNYSVAMLICCLALVLLLNTRYLISFTPLIDRELKKNMQQMNRLQPKPEATVFLSKDTLFFAGDLHFMTIPLADLLAIRETRHALALYMKRDAMLTIPRPEPHDMKQYMFFVIRIKGVLRRSRK